MNGILNILKPVGYTSHDVVAVLRRCLHTRKIGHTGTLDPSATGVLPICIGRATRVSDILVNSDKEYVAEIRLGASTDTQDSDGTVISTSTIRATYTDVASACKHFTGDIEQIPPMYSAVKVDGKKLYELARKGIEVERKPRKVTIYKIDILDFEEDEQILKVRVSCSKGTYIRTLAHDLGVYLKTYGHITSLTRTKSSLFSIENSISLEKIEEIYKNNKIDEFLINPSKLFCGYESIVLDEIDEFRVKNGNYLVFSKYKSEFNENVIYRVFNKAGEFLALYITRTTDRQVLVSYKSFFEPIA